jgi:putative SOS response-associated peptidase YedK
LARLAFGEEPMPRTSDIVLRVRTTEANAIVAPIHSKAMPVILTTTVALRLNVRFALVYEHHCS